MQLITASSALAALLLTTTVNAACPPGYRQHRHTPSTSPTPTPTAYYTYYPTAAASSSSSSSSATPVPTTDTSLAADQQSALDTQNAARADVGVAALSWSASLAADAQTWADHLASLGSPGQLVHDTDSSEGENLYWQSGGSDPFAAAAKAWVAEKSAYDGEAITGSGNFEEYGHYSMYFFFHLGGDFHFFSFC